MNIDRKYLILIFILGLAFYVRLSFLGMNRLHMDECLYSAYAMRMVDRGDIALNGGLQVDKPPLFFYFIALSFLITKTFSESAVRLPNIIFSMITIFYILKIINILYKNFTMAILTSFFTAFSIYNIAFSVSAFQDISMTTFFILSLYMILKEKYFLSAFFYAFSVGCKPMTLFMFPLYFMFIVLLGSSGFDIFKSQLKALICGMSYVFVPIILWSGFLANPRWGIIKFFIIQQPEVINFTSNYTERFLTWLNYSKHILNEPVFIYTGFAGLFVLVLIGIFGKSKFLKEDLFFLTSIIYFFTLLTFIKFRQFDRYLVPMVPFFALSLSRTIFTLVSFFKSEKLRITFLIFVIICFYLYIFNIRTLCAGQGAFFNGSNGFEDVAEYLRLHQNKNGRIIYFGHKLNNYGFYYLYYAKFESAISVFSEEELEKNLKNGKNYVVVDIRQLNLQTLINLNQKYKKVFESGYEKIDSKDGFVYNFQVFEFVR